VALNWQVDRNLAYLFVARGYKPGGFNSVTSSFQPETVLNYELGLKSTLAGGRVRTQLAAFYNNYSDFQFDVLEPLAEQGGIFNVADGTIQGLEAGVEACHAGVRRFGAGRPDLHQPAAARHPGLAVRPACDRVRRSASTMRSSS
jgi:iron complex outermembrane receptor protein